MEKYINTYKCLNCRIWWISTYDEYIADECPECCEDYDPAEWYKIPTSRDITVHHSNGYNIPYWMEHPFPNQICRGELSGDGEMLRYNDN